VVLANGVLCAVRGASIPGCLSNEQNVFLCAVRGLSIPGHVSKRCFVCSVEGVWRSKHSQKAVKSAARGNPCGPIWWPERFKAAALEL